ncbi:hypothetical protein M885DRAFT_577679 [Pelagophyceae sp. CCMP2097]|nr:hypothetical protein M885DRAFT_577679 [Pelagophyceae sp. CCMP2097]
MVKISAQSGVAAKGCGGGTNHGTFGLTVKDANTGDEDDVGCEFGTLGARTFGEIETNMRNIWHTGNGVHLGSKSFVFFGHHAQLPPVSDRRLYVASFSTTNQFEKLPRLQKYGAQLCSLVMERTKVVILKAHKRRTKMDANSRRLEAYLSNAMDGKNTFEDWMFLRDNSLDKKPAVADPNNECRYLKARREDVATGNIKYVCALSKRTGKAVVRVKAFSTGDPKGRRAVDTLCCGVQAELWLEGEYFVASALSHIPNVIRVDMTTESFLIDGKHCSRTNFHISLAGAMTIHKSQGLTLPWLCIALGPTEHSIGIKYTSASRATGTEGIAWDPVPSLSRLTSYKSSAQLGFRREEKKKLDELADVARTAEVHKARFLEEITKARAAAAIAQAEAVRAKLQQRKDERGGKTKADRKKRAVPFKGEAAGTVGGPGTSSRPNDSTTTAKRKRKLEAPILLAQTNPKEKFSLAHRLYEVYKAATTVADFMTLGETATYLREDFYAGYLTYLDKGTTAPLTVLISNTCEEDEAGYHYFAETRGQLLNSCDAKCAFEAAIRNAKHMPWPRHLCPRQRPIIQGDGKQKCSAAGYTVDYAFLLGGEFVSRSNTAARRGFLGEADVGHNKLYLLEQANRDYEAIGEPEYYPWRVEPDPYDPDRLYWADYDKRQHPELK